MPRTSKKEKHSLVHTLRHHVEKLMAHIVHVLSEPDLVPVKVTARGASKSHARRARPVARKKK
jgi:hypothetical protein